MSAEAAQITIAEFLLARIAEDEDEAERAVDRLGDDPLNHDPDYPGHVIGEAPQMRMLAECEAKRRIVELHADVGRQCVTCALPSGRGASLEPAVYPCDTILALAHPYAAHPDFRDEWRLADTGL